MHFLPHTFHAVKHVLWFCMCRLRYHTEVRLVCWKVLSFKSEWIIKKCLIQGQRTTPVNYTRLCAGKNFTSSSLILSSAVFCFSISWLLISSFDCKINLKVNVILNLWTRNTSVVTADETCRRLHNGWNTYMRPTPSYMRVLLGSDVISTWVRLACFFMRLSCSICRSASFTFCCVSIILACNSPKAWETNRHEHNRFHWCMILKGQNILQRLKVSLHFAIQTYLLDS